MRFPDVGLRWQARLAVLNLHRMFFVAVAAFIGVWLFTDDGWGYIDLVFLPLGFPIGTALGIYVWSQTGRKKWRGA